MTELPTTFGKYYLTEKLATGGMAEIYLAKIIGPGGFEKQIVIKQIHPRLSGNRHFVDLFVAEAKTLVTLAHGNIVPVYELGVIDDTYFIAMEYIDGPTLYRLTEFMSRRDGQMDPALAAFIAARMLEGLDYAHRKGEGVIHRDLSPRNVMLSRDGEIKLVDFGIAVTLGDTGEGDARESAPTGSFPYMSPEQVRREALTGQTDLFSVGVLLWEMLAGRRLFARPDPDATLEAVLRADIPRPSEVRPEVPAKLDEVVMRALERDQTARWPTAGDMLAALNKYLYSLDETPGPRDVAALVAKFCPPETRRMPTHVEALPPEAEVESDKPVGSGPSTAAIPRDQPAGPRTAVIPRDKQPRGKPQKQTSFATNVDYKNILDRATPLFAFDAIDDEPKPPEEPKPEPGAPQPLKIDPGAVVREPPSRTALIVLGIGGIALAVAAVIMFLKSKEHMQIIEEFEDAGIGETLDAATPDAIAVVPAPIDAGIDAPQIDAGREPQRDAGHRNGSAAVRTSSDAGVEAPRGTAKLAIGADPWGEIYIDGKSAGRTPKEITVSAGRHTVEVVFPAESPPRKQTFGVDLANGEKKALQADFR
ncbi:MAG: serine/threonine protein kinase [Kofleriaceae bacterium]|nr:serine/threonine protein kinase [Kofleriaceae bacterium]